MTWIPRLLCVSAITIAACATDVQVEVCPQGTLREANRCVPDAPLAIATPLADAGPPVDAGPPADGGSLDAGPADSGQGQVSVPFYVDDHFAMSGFFPGPPGVVDIVEACGVSGTDPGSVCRRITFTPNGGGFGGFFFQSPADNWGAEPGLPVAPGATQITFRAWGATGSELVKFGAGIDNNEPNADGWNVETAAIALGTMPTELSVNLGSVTYDRVVGGFLWVVETPDTSTPVTFFLDNVRWE